MLWGSSRDRFCGRSLSHPHVAPRGRFLVTAETTQDFRGTRRSSRGGWSGVCWGMGDGRGGVGVGERSVPSASG